MTHKKLGLLLLPLIPLTAIGIVEIADRVLAPAADEPAQVTPVEPLTTHGPQPQADA